MKKSKRVRAVVAVISGVANNRAAQIAKDIMKSKQKYAPHALYLVSCYHTGGEILEMRNPGDYPYDPDDEPEYEIVEV